MLGWDQDLLCKCKSLPPPLVLFHTDFHFISFIQHAPWLMAHFPANSFLSPG